MSDKPTPRVPLKQRAANSAKRFQSNFYEKGPLNIQIFSLCLIVLSGLVIMFAVFGITNASRFLMIGISAVWIAISLLILWATVAYQRLIDNKQDG